INIEDVAHIGISRDPSAHLHKKILFAATRAAKQSRQWAVGSGQTGAAVAVDDEGKPNGNGTGPGIFRQVKDRLQNAARVRDLKDDLAQALGASPASLRAQFHNV